MVKGLICYNSNMMANLGLHFLHVTNAVFFFFFAFFFCCFFFFFFFFFFFCFVLCFNETTHIRAFVRLYQISIVRTKDDVG